MKKFIYTIAAASMMFTGCVKDEIYTPPAPEASEIVLNELMSKDPVTDVDWIELYNSGDVDVDISGYLLNDKADPTGGFEIPAGTIITAKGYYLVDQNTSGIAISSGGEDVSLGSPDGKLLDYIFCEASNGDGTTFGRETDGAETWVNGMIATPGAANGNAEVKVPIVSLKFPVAPAAGDAVNVEVSYVTTETVTEARIYYSLGDAPAYDKGNKIKGEDQADFSQTGVTIPMKSVVDGSDLSVAGELVSFYVRIALDNGIEYYYDKDGNPIADNSADDSDDKPSDDFKADPTQWNTYKAISGGVAAPTLAIEFSATPTKGYEALNLTYAADIKIDEVRVYFGYGDSPVYVKGNKIKGENEDSFTQTGVSISMANKDVEDADGNVIGNTSDGSKISFYVRIALENGTEYYYDNTGTVIVDDEANGGDPADADAFKADPTKWNTFTGKDAVEVSQFDYPTAPTSTEEINVVLAYSSSEEIVETRIYYTNGTVDAYVKGNKIKGEDDDTFTQTGVTINMAAKDVEDADGNVVGTTSDSGKTIKFYVRIATATSEYYFGSNGDLLAVDDTPADGATDTSDAFKADTSKWQVYTVK